MHDLLNVMFNDPKEKPFLVLPMKNSILLKPIVDSTTQNILQMKARDKSKGKSKGRGRGGRFGSTRMSFYNGSVYNRPSIPTGPVNRQPQNYLQTNHYSQSESHPQTNYSQPELRTPKTYPQTNYSPANYSQSLSTAPKIKSPTPAPKRIIGTYVEGGNENKIFNPLAGKSSNPSEQTVKNLHNGKESIKNGQFTSVPVSNCNLSRAEKSPTKPISPNPNDKYREFELDRADYVNSMKNLSVDKQEENPQESSQYQNIQKIKSLTKSSGNLNTKLLYEKFNKGLVTNYIQLLVRTQFIR